MEVPIEIMNRFRDGLSLRLNGVRYCGNRLQTDGVELYVVTGDYNPSIKEYMTYMAVHHTPSENIRWISMMEDGKQFPWITKKMAEKINIFKQLNYHGSTKEKEVCR